MFRCRTASQFLMPPSLCFLSFKILVDILLGCTIGKVIIHRGLRCFTWMAMSPADLIASNCGVSWLELLDVGNSEGMDDEGVPNCSSCRTSGTPVGVPGIGKTGVLCVAADCAIGSG